MAADTIRPLTAGITQVRQTPTTGTAITKTGELRTIMEFTNNITANPPEPF
jgi:hypothetical protein